MGLRVQFKRGASKYIMNHAFDDGEIVINTDTKSLHVGDGETLGGHEIPSKVEVENIVKDAVSISKDPEDLENGSFTVSQSSNVITEDPDVSILALQNDIWGYKSNKSYTVNEYVLYQGDIYKCIQDNTVTVDGETTHIAPTDGNYWVKVATLADLVSKADKDFTNINNTAKIAIAHNAMPSNVYDELTRNIPTSTYFTAPADGYININATTTGNAYLLITIWENNVLIDGVLGSSTAGIDIYAFIPIKKGDRYKLDHLSLTGFTYHRFIYAVGSESEKA